MEKQTPREILSKFYADNNFGADGGVSSASVKIQLTSWFHFYYPNFKSRNRAVLKHDIHHLVTGYSTNLWGETEISMWEIASGCKSYRGAFFVDVSGAMLGIPWNMWRVMKAFARGRKTKNLYHEFFTNKQALDMKVSELQKHLLLDKHGKNTKPSFTDVILFFAFAIFGTVYSFLALILLPFIIVYSIYIEIKTRIAKG